MKSLVLILILTYGLFAAAKTTIVCGMVDNFANSSRDNRDKKDSPYPLIMVSSKTGEQFELVNTDNILIENPDLERGSVQKSLCVKGVFVGESKLRVIDSWEKE